MKIKWLGHSCFLISTNAGRKIMTDPYDEHIGPFPDISADVITVSHQHADHNAVELVPGKHLVIEKIGEHALDDVKITGISTYHDKSNGSQRGTNTLFVIEADGVRVCHLGDLGHLLGQEHINALGKIDVLMVPVGGFYTIDANEAKAVVGQLDPAVVLPMHYLTNSLNMPISGIDEFLKYYSNVLETSELEISQDLLSKHQQVVKLSITPSLF